MITTIGNVFRIAVVWLIWNGKFLLAAALWFISYYFDCLDGYVARKYKMMSKFGSLYDHVSDILFICLTLLLLLYLRHRFIKFWLPSIILLFAATFLFYSIQESYYDSNEEMDGLVNFLINIYPKVSKEDSIILLKYARWFGPGTNTVAISCIIASYKL
jgi:phosphatidylglycerophosphate synthase